MKSTVILLLLVLLVALGPLATIWALNTLFPALALDYSLETWMAVILLGLFLGGPSPGKR